MLTSITEDMDYLAGMVNPGLTRQLAYVIDDFNGSLGERFHTPVIFAVARQWRAIVEVGRQFFNRRAHAKRSAPAFAAIRRPAAAT
jgi:hypothetical protein